VYSFFEVPGDYAPNIVIGFRRLGGARVGIVANQPAHLAGCLDISASVQGAPRRFVRSCDCFNIPLVTVRKTCRLLPGTGPRSRRHHQHEPSCCTAYCEATVPADRHQRGRRTEGLLRVHVLEATHPRRRQLRLPHGGDRGHGTRRSRETSCTKREKMEKQRENPAGLKEEERRSEYSREKFEVANPYVRPSVGYIDEVIEAPATPGAGSSRPSECSTPSADRPNPPRKHGEHAPVMAPSWTPAGEAAVWRRLRRRAWGKRQTPSSRLTLTLRRPDRAGALRRPRTRRSFLRRGLQRPKHTRPSTTSAIPGFPGEPPYKRARDAAHECTAAGSGPCGQ